VRDVSPFIVPLRTIPPEGVARTLTLSGGWAERNLAEIDAEATTTGLRADLRLLRAGYDVHMSGRMTGEVVLRCGRCLEAAPTTIDTEVNMTYVPAGEEPTSDEKELEISDDMVDVKPYEGDAIDLEETLREELLLALPYAPLCREDCKGLCPRCGKELNDGACTCPPEPPVEDRWSELKGVKL
jgi:uncharacterized protein